ncbi:hypothetical protein R1flu_025985 [Riccia fluitans]|uniref:Uncharacterized protein n=1 Tax=Riccia fluitans TaxID=41844 RepID=A0ABD1XEP6_9MARC
MKLTYMTLSCLLGELGQSVTLVLEHAPNTSSSSVVRQLLVSDTTLRQISRDCAAQLIDFKSLSATESEGDAGIDFSKSGGQSSNFLP